MQEVIVDVGAQGTWISAEAALWSALVHHRLQRLEADSLAGLDLGG